MEHNAIHEIEICLKLFFDHLTRKKTNIEIEIAIHLIVKRKNNICQITKIND